MEYVEIQYTTALRFLGINQVAQIYRPCSHIEGQEGSQRLTTSAVSLCKRQRPLTSLFYRPKTSLLASGTAYNDEAK